MGGIYYKNVPRNSNAPVNLRKSWSASSEKIGSIPVGAVVEFDEDNISEASGWIGVKYENMRGFVSGAYFEQCDANGVLLNPSNDTFNNGGYDNVTNIVTEEKGNKTWLVVGGVIAAIGAGLNLFL